MPKFLVEFEPYGETKDVVTADDIRDEIWAVPIGGAIDLDTLRVTEITDS